MPKVRKVSYVENAEKIITDLKCARNLYGYDQREAAQMVGMSQNWLSDVENGVTKLTINKACEIADLYGMELRLCDTRQG